MVMICLPDPDKYGLAHQELSDGPFTKLEIIELILSNYTENPKNRALEFGVIPRLFTKDGRYDPLGLALENPEHFNHFLGYSIYRITGAYRNMHTDEYVHTAFGCARMFKRFYRGHELKFWNDLSEFHNNNSYYTETGVSSAGKIQLEILKSKWASANNSKRQ